MAQGDDKLQMPIINNLANEVWKCKEAKQTVDDAPTLGDPERRGILMEAVGAVTYLMAGSDILIMRHPEAIRLVKAFIDIAMDGGSAADIAPIAKKLEGVSVDLAALAPEPDLTIEEEKKGSQTGGQGRCPRPPPNRLPSQLPNRLLQRRPNRLRPLPRHLQPEAEAKAKAEAEAKAGGFSTSTGCTCIRRNCRKIRGGTSDGRN
jgi:acetyl-CoA decarbonylase/synthase complex subunit delta